MANTANIQLTVNIEGLLISSSVTETDEAVLRQSIAASQLNTPVSGTLSTRTGDDGGVITTSGHSIADASKVDVYWAGGSRYGMVSSAADATTLTVAGGVGDNFPIATTAITVCVQKNIDFSCDGDEMTVLAQQFSQDGRATFCDSSDAVLTSFLLNANVGNVWYNASGVTRPITGNPVSYIAVTNKATAGVYSVGTLFNTI